MFAESITTLIVQIQPLLRSKRHVINIFFSPHEIGCASINGSQLLNVNFQLDKFNNALVKSTYLEHNILIEKLFERFIY